MERALGASRPNEDNIFGPRALVVGAVIVDSLAQPRRVLAARRSGSNALQGRWEFPGGKVEPGESAEAALVREVQEELDVTLMLGHELMPPSGQSWPISEDLDAATLLGRDLRRDSDHGGVARRSEMAGR